MQAQQVLSSRIRQARGVEPADLVLRGGQVLDLVTGDLISGDVAIEGDTIVGIGESYHGREIRDVSGLVLVPGFIDTHLHVESSLVTPFEFERCVLPRGITTAICDPHEIANVLGVPGICYFLEASERMVMSLRVNLSSCVPSSHMETAGAYVSHADLAPLMGHPAVIGLAELMNYPGVIHEDPEVMAKLNLFFGQHIDGHAPLLSGRDLNAYISAGIRTEHEATSAEEAREKLQKGMRVLIREGSVSKDLDALLPVLSDRTAPYMCFCTDDRNPLDIEEQGHLDYMIRHAIASGVPPLAAYRTASLSAAEAFGLKDRGQIAPGKRADIVAIGALEACDAQLVVAGGRVVDDACFAARDVFEAPGRQSVQANPVHATSLKVQARTPETPVIGILEGKILTEFLTIDIPLENGVKQADPTRDLAKISIIERHGLNGNIASGFVRGFGLKEGAVGSTVCHDHHNIAVVGANDDDMALAANRLREIEGGFVVVQNGAVTAELPLPVAGLMSDQRFEVVLEELIRLRAAAKALGIVLEEPFLQLAFVALPVIPALKITDHGMVDVTKFELIS